MKLVVRTSSTMVGGMSALMASTAVAFNEAENRHTWQTIKWTDSTTRASNFTGHRAIQHTFAAAVVYFHCFLQHFGVATYSRCPLLYQRRQRFMRQWWLYCWCGWPECVMCVCVCVWRKRTNLSKHQTKSNTIIESNNYLQAFMKANEYVWCEDARCQSRPQISACKFQWKCVLLHTV